MKLQQHILKHSMTAALVAGITVAPFAGADERSGDIYIAPAEASAAEAATPAEALALAMIRGNTVQCLRSATLSGVDAQGQVFNAPISLANFPTDGTSFTVLSSGVAAQAGPSTAAASNPSTSMGGITLPPGPQASPDGLTSNDVVTLTLTFDLPTTPGNLTFDWKLGSEEPPTYTQTYPDYLRADVSDTLGTTNIALLPDTSPATQKNMVNGAYSNSPTGSSGAPLPPYPVPDNSAYNAVANNVQVASHDLNASGGTTISLALRVADVNDTILDTAAFLDNLKIEGCDAVAIDIKPHSDPNSINTCSNGAVPVAILGSEVLDVSQIDPSTVTLADAGVKMVGKSDKLLCAIEDVNDDGYDDLVCHMVTVDLGLDSGDTTATVTAQLLNGGMISGSDTVNIVKDECE